MVMEAMLKLRLRVLIPAVEHAVAWRRRSDQDRHCAPRAIARACWSRCAKRLPTARTVTRRLRRKRHSGVRNETGEAAGDDVGWSWTAMISTPAWAET